jgi:phosphate transport system permease protein
MTDLAAAVAPDQYAFDPTAPLTPSGNLRRRLLASQLLVLGAVTAAAIAVAALGLVTFEVAKHGASVLSVGFVTRNASGFAGGGIAAELVGTALIALFAAVIAVPIGVLIAIYLSEFAGSRSRVARWMKLMLDLMQGLPTIIVGLFVFGLMVNGHHTSGIAGSIALSIVMLPLIARSSQEVLRLVPGSLREASDALGVARWRSIVGVVLPAALPGIVTGAILATARAAGETAPLLLCSGVFNPAQTTINVFGLGMPNIPLLILQSSEQASQASVARAWGAALVLLGAILVANIGARILLGRWRRRIGT